MAVRRRIIRSLYFSVHRLFRVVLLLVACRALRFFTFLNSLRELKPKIKVSDYREVQSVLEQFFNELKSRSFYMSFLTRCSLIAPTSGKNRCWKFGKREFAKAQRANEEGVIAKRATGSTTRASARANG